MPYILRDPKGKIYHVSAGFIHGSEMVPHNHAELDAFLRAQGLDPAGIAGYLAELHRTDGEMVRSIEDILLALLKKNILKIIDLPQPVQQRINKRVELRAMIQAAYDQASRQHSRSLEHAIDLEHT